jgi:hypothetical protein
MGSRGGKGAGEEAEAGEAGEETEQKSVFRTPSSPSPSPLFPHSLIVPLFL